MSVPRLSRRALLQALVAGSAVSPAFGRPPAARVIVVGAGFGGASCAKYLHLLSPRTQVVLIDRRPDFLTGPFSNLVIAGLRTEQSIRRRTTAIGRAHGVELHVDTVTSIDPTSLRVGTSSGKVLRADRIVLSPGIGMRWELTEGLSAANSALMPHAWLGDGQVAALRDKLQKVPDGGIVLIGAPPNPFRCPPGPYERASLVAHALMKSGRTRAKVIVADAKDDFSKSALFRLEWDQLYPGMIEWIPRAQGGEVVRVEPDNGQVWLRGTAEPVQASLASIIPAQRAADLAHDADLVDESGWCPVDPATFESTRHARIHIIGDAAIAAPMPKSAFAASSQAKLCAAVIAAELAGDSLPDPQLLNTCYSLVSDSEAISVSGYYATVNGKLTAISEAMSPIAADASLRSREAQQAKDWYSSITADSFGSAFKV